MARELTRVGNPSSLHTSGRRARQRLEEAREQLAEAVGAHPSEVVFTAGGTEADNIAVRGSWAARRPERNAVAVSAIEHPAVLETAGAMERDGAEVHTLAVDDDGRLVAAQWTADLAVASVMWVNNETGTVNAPGSWVEGARAVGAWTHSDAVQAFGHLPLTFADSGLDLMSVTAHKIGGPVGIGALLVRREITPLAVMAGGGQERDLRSGTLTVALAAGFAEAASVAVASLEADRARWQSLRERVLEWAGGCAGVHPNPAAGEVSPAIVNLTFDGCLADDLLLLLDAAGVDCSSGSACHAGVSRPSPVLLEMGRSEAAATGSLRISFGPTTDADEVAAVLTALEGAVPRARAARS